MGDSLKFGGKGEERSVSMEDGYELVMDYGDPVAEHLAAAKGAGIIDLSGWKTLEITGGDRASWLNSMTTNNIKSLPEGRGAYSLVVNLKGKILADFFVYALPDRLLVLAERRCAQTMLNTLERYIITEDAAMRDVSDGHVTFSVQGPDSLAVLRRVFPEFPEKMGRGEAVMLESGDETLLVMENARCAWGGLDVAAPSEAALPFWNVMLEAGAAPIGMTALESLRIEAGLPLYGTDMDDSYFPHEAKLENRAVDFNKGCYIGQETICRIQSRGQVNRIVTGALLPDEGEFFSNAGLPVELFDGDEPAGKLTSAAYSPVHGKRLGLMTVKRRHAEPGARLTVRSGGGETVVEAVQLPLPIHGR